MENRDKVKKIIKNIFKVIEIIALIIVLLAVGAFCYFKFYVFGSYTIKAKNIETEDIEVLKANIGISYIPGSLKISKIEVPRWTVDEYYICYDISIDDYAEMKRNLFIEKGEPVGRMSGIARSEIETKGDRVYYKTWLSSDAKNQFEDVRDIVNKYKK